MPSPKLCFSLSSVCTILSVLHCAIAVLVNRTIDDENGDSETGIKPVYTPADGWAQGATCDACAVNSSLVDASQVFNRTWHSTTSGMDERTITISFSGIAVDVFFIVARSMPSTLAQTNMTITIDVAVDSQTPVVFPDVNDASYNFVHQFPSLVNGKPVYSARLFSQSGLPNEAHTLRIHTAGATNNLYAFDYLQYVAYDSSVATAPAPVSSGATSQDFSTGQATSLFLSPTSSVNDIPNAPPRTTSHGPNIGALAGGIIGGLALVLLLGVYVSRRRWLHGRPEGRNSAAGGDGKDGLAILFADSDSTSCSPSEDFIDELPGPGNVRSPSTIYAMFAQRSDPEGNPARHDAVPDPTNRQNPSGGITNMHGSRVSLPPSYAVHQPRSDPDTLQRASSPSGMSHHTVLPPYSSAPPSLAYAGARRHVELTRLIRVLEGQLRTHDALHAPAPRPSDPPGSQDSQTPNSLTGAHDAKTRSEKPTRRTRGRERVDARGRAEEEEHAAKRTRLAALLSELTEARTLLAEEAQMRPASEPVLASSTVPDRELR